MNPRDHDLETGKLLSDWTRRVEDYRPPPTSLAPEGKLRGGHPKGHGIVRARLRVRSDLPASLRVAVFADAREWPCRVRFSNVQGGVFSDARDMRGAGVKLLTDDEAHTVQDFNLTSVETIPVRAYADLSPVSFIRVIEETVARDPSHPDAPRLDTNLLTATFFSIAAFRFGRDRIARFSLAPHPDNPAPDTLEAGADDDLQRSLRHNLGRDVCWRFVLRAQFPPEDAVDAADHWERRWGTPWHELATLEIPPQDVTPPAEDPLERRFYTSPAQCHPDLAPVGALNQARTKIYATSRAARRAAGEPEAFPFRPATMRVAVVGGGGAGMAAAWALASQGHPVTLLEASERLGGHAVTVEVEGRSVDPGFGVFTRHTHPNLLRLCETLDIPTEAIVPFERGRSWRTPVGDTSWTTLADLPFHREVLAQVAEFQRSELPSILRDPRYDRVTVGEFARERALSDAFVKYYLFGQAIYLFPGHPERYYLDIPLRPLLRHAFDLARHGDQSVLRMKGGSSAYVARFEAALRATGRVDIRTRAHVRLAARDASGVDLVVDGETLRFDHVVLACNPRRALQVLGDAADARERDALGRVGHTVNAPVAHAHAEGMPARREHWTYHNMVCPAPDALGAPYTLRATKSAPCNRDPGARGFVTHDYTPGAHLPRGVRVAFEHVDLDRATFEAREALTGIQGVRRTWFAGAWTRGLTWHDDAIASGLVAANGITAPVTEVPVLASYATAPDAEDSGTLPLAAFAQVLARVPDKEFLAFVDDDGKTVERHSPRTLDRRTRQIAAWLVARCDVRRGDRVVLAFPPGLAFFEAFMGCLRAGAVPVPVYPPVPGCSRGDLAAFAHVTRDCDARLGLCPSPFDVSLPAYLAEVLERDEAVGIAGLAWRATDAPEVDAMAPEGAPSVAFSQGDVAFLQYTSGSTRAPRGVMITHGNLAHQAQAVCRDALGLDGEGVGVSWLPMYHDFALISALLLAMQTGFRAVFMAPQSFVRRPALWFELIDRERATAVAAPDFAYALAVRRTTPEARAGWDLSCLKVVMSAAEPVRPETVDAFLRAFKPSKLDPRAFCPAYGLAEHTVGVTVSGRRIAHVDLEALAAERRVRPGRYALTGCGTPPPGVHVRVVNPETRRACEPGEVGEVWVTSASKALGYWNLPTETAAVFEARIEGDDGARAWLRTGDEGFLWQNELFITGRIKDVVIVRGRNYAAPDLERAATGAHDALRPGGTVAVQHPTRDGVALLAEVTVSEAPTLRAVAGALRDALARGAGLRPDTIALVGPRALPRTTSGKVQRQRARELFARDELALLHREDGELGASSEAARSAVSSPRTEPEAIEALTALVFEFTRVRPDPDEDALATVGADSLQVVELGVAVEKVFRRPVTATELYQHKSVRALARHLLGLTEVSRTRAPRLMAAPPEPLPAFVSPPTAGTLASVAELARMLGRQRRVYGLERGTGSFDDVLGEHLADVTAALAGGRACILAGASFGGMVALALAEALRARGVRVPLVLALDAYHPAGYGASERHPRDMDLAWLAGAIAPALRQELPAHATSLEARIATLLPAWRRAVAPDADANAMRRALEQNLRWLREMSERYASAPSRPTLPDTELVYVRALKRPVDNRGAESLRAHFGRTTVIDADGDHFAVLRAGHGVVEGLLPRLRAYDP